MTRYENLTLDEERALYGIHGAVVENCTFDGPADGESALKECGDIAVYNCDMRLRYPLWHVHRAELKDVRMTDTCPGGPLVRLRRDDQGQQTARD